MNSIPSMAIRNFLTRVKHLVHNLVHINHIDHRLAVMEEQVHVLDHRAVEGQQRFEALEMQVNLRLHSLEISASTSGQRLDAIEQRLHLLETTVTKAVEKAFMQEIYSQLHSFQKHINQERFFFPSPPQRPKLAFISPLPPENSGVSNYSGELLPELARYYDIEVIVVHPVISDTWVNTYCPIRSVAWFKEHAADYERVVYQFGNSPFHTHMFALLQDHPGVVVLHDFFLSSVLAYEEGTGVMPGAWTNALVQSHGYRAVKDSFGVNGIEFAKNAYPCNLAVIREARGVIVHSEYSRQLARQWYGPHAADDWAVIPHLRTPVVTYDRIAARQVLGIDEAAFLVCSFGFIDPTKLSHRLLDAWLASRLRNDPDGILVLVGGNHPGDYGTQLSESIRNSGFQDRIRITGWADDATYRHYLQAADVSVQLRGLSRGETSGSVLHCLNYGLPTIINANGSMADLPTEVAWKLADTFDNADLVTALEALWENTDMRHKMGAAAREFIRTQHDPKQCARQYADAIETTYNEPLIGPHVNALALSDKLRPRQLLVDVSNIARHDLRTGIERVVRAQVLALLNHSNDGLRVEPVLFINDDGEPQYRYARSYTCEILGIDSAKLADAPITINAGDIFYAPDFAPQDVIVAARSGLYAKWKASGVSINFLIHDLLPILRPDFFPDHTNRLHAEWLDCIAENADQLICISHAVAADVRTYLRQPKHLGTHSPEITVIYHGADIDASAPSLGMPENTDMLFAKIAATPSFLMVGTIEPRKGYLQTLAAFEQLWDAGEQVNLIIVGNEGWTALAQHERRTIPVIIDQLQHHPELGKRLFWLEGISDEWLQKLYAASTCLLVASEGEGFGLPLIEAAKYKLPIIARDLPVFHEIAQENATYFSGLATSDLVDVVRKWLLLRANGTVPTSTAIHWNSWAENADELTAILMKDKRKISKQ